MADRVFISYASQDREIADAVCEALESRGVPCWIAPRDITPGSDYAQALYDAIGECAALVLIFSERANASPQVRREVERAFRDGDPIIPFRIDDAAPERGLQFSIGAVEWLAPASVDLTTHIGILVEIVIARLTSRGGAPEVPSIPQRAWLGSPGVVRRLVATWMTVLLWIGLSLAVINCLMNADALANAAWSRSVLDEESPAERITGVTGILLILLLPSTFVWLIWLCASYLTLETAAIESLPYGAGSAPGRFMWPGIRFDGGSSVIARLWEASWQLTTPRGDRARQAVNAPWWMWPLWWLAAALPPLTLTTAIVADGDEWSDAAIISTSMATDLVWIAGAVLCLCTLRPIEKRLRQHEAVSTARSPREPRSVGGGGP
jgi:TIR domain